MKKLSELSNDTYIWVGEEMTTMTDIMTKEDYIAKKEHHKGKKIYETEERYPEFSFSTIVENDSWGMYEDWEVNVLTDMESYPIFKECEKILNEIYELNKTYYKYDEIENDIE